MTDKGRLGKIKALLAQRDQHIDVEGQINYHEYDQIIFELNDFGHIDWLYKQAERAQKIEQILEDMDRQLYREQKQNKRLREAIIEAIADIEAISPHEAKKTLREALNNGEN